MLVKKKLINRLFLQSNSITWINVQQNLIKQLHAVQLLYIYAKLGCVTSI